MHTRDLLDNITRRIFGRPQEVSGMETVLSYHDSLLKKSDVDLLEGAGWLNDKILGFYFE